MNERDQKCNLRWSTGWRRRGQLPLLRTEAPHSRAPLLAIEMSQKSCPSELGVTPSLLGADGNKSGPIDSVRSAGKTLTRTSRRSKRRWTVRVVLPNLLRRQALQLGKDLAHFEAKEMPDMPSPVARSCGQMKDRKLCSRRASCPTSHVSNKCLSAVFWRAVDKTCRRSEPLQRLKKNIQILGLFMPVSRCRSAAMNKYLVQNVLQEFCQAIWDARDGGVEVSSQANKGQSLNIARTLCRPT